MWTADHHGLGCVSTRGTAFTLTRSTRRSTTTSRLAGDARTWSWCSRCSEPTFTRVHRSECARPPVPQGGCCAAMAVGAIGCCLVRAQRRSPRSIEALARTGATSYSGEYARLRRSRLAFTRTTARSPPASGSGTDERRRRPAPRRGRGAARSGGHRNHHHTPGARVAAPAAISGRACWPLLARVRRPSRGRGREHGMRGSHSSFYRLGQVADRRLAARADVDRLEVSSRSAARSSARAASST